MPKGIGPEQKLLCTGLRGTLLTMPVHGTAETVWNWDNRLSYTAVLDNINIHLELLQGMTEGFYCLHVEMISRFVKDKEIWTMHKQRQEHH